MSRAALGELAHKLNWNQGRTFSLFGLCSAIGYILDPTLGGYLVASENNVVLKSSQPLFTDYPFLLPCVISGFYNIVAAVLCLAMMEDTKDLPAARPLVAETQGSTSTRSALNATETEPLLEGQHQIKGPEVDTSHCRNVSAVSCVVSLMWVYKFKHEMMAQIDLLLGFYHSML